MLTIMPRRSKCCAGFHPIQGARGRHLKAPPCQPASASHRSCQALGRGITQPPARKTAEPEIVMGVHQVVPQRALGGLHQAKLDIGIAATEPA